MKEWAKEATKAGAATATGAAGGAAIYGIIGGVGVAATGTAVGITLGPFLAIGASVGLGAYGIYRLGKQVGKKSAGKKS